MSEPTGYLWESAQLEEKARLDAQASIWDPYSRRYIEGLGIAPGWRCLEVGAGTGTMTTWLADRVSPGGSVVAADIDTTFLRGIDRRNVEIRELDVTAVDPTAEFDLVYSRLVLCHLPNPDTHLETLVGFVRPGGWVLVQDTDFGFLETPASRNYTLPPSNQRFAVKIAKALNGLMGMTGADKTVAQRHPRRLWELGLEEVRAEVVTRLERGEPGGTFQTATARVAPYLAQYGGVSEKDAQRRVAQLGDPSIGFTSAPMVAAWGRKPGERSETPG